MPSITPRLIAASLLLGSGLLSAQEAVTDPEKQLAEKMAAAQGRLQKTSPTQYTLGTIQIDAAKREIRFPCTLLHQQIPIEYILVHETGKDHETILTTAVTPIDLQVALLLANYQPGTRGILDTLDPKAERPYPEKEETSPEKPGANRLAIHCEWKEGDEVKRVPLSAFIQDSDTRKTPADLDTWIFNGSRIDEEGYVAEITGSIISTYVDRSAIINSTAKGNHRDELWISMPDNIPAEETKVTLIITPAK
jgi:hypothetical protein